MATVLEEMGKKKVHNRKAFRFGSYGWSGGAQKELGEIIAKLNMNWDFIEPVEFLGMPEDKDLEKVGDGVKEIVKQVKEMFNNK